ncbi:MAG: bifunctional riboflavin kinase/FMN adenylyltransferase, partial [Alphaproteobacteria bacterium]|nr:bifunctional riboflavin kinase/FMN adenylyltransferase [Alphaproteobacteria bacterium]
PFTKEIASMTWKDFVKQMLIDSFSISHLVCGSNFAFGKNRKGNLKVISEELELNSVKTTKIDNIRGDNEMYSSTAVRKLLIEGCPEKAAHILGRNWAIEGTIVHGKGIGNSELKIRTANVLLGDYIRPKLGVYVVKAHRFCTPKEKYSGIANIGKNPTVNGHEVVFEAHIFDFNQEIYSEDWEFEILHFMRPEINFTSLSELKKQIEADIMEARRFLTHGI